ncbi:MAG: sensor histidine kinase [Bacteroidales bacterium]
MTLGRVKRSRLPGLDLPDPQHATAISSTLAGARLVLAVVSLVAVRIDPTHPGRFAVLALDLLVGFTLYAVAVFAAARVRPSIVVKYGRLLHGCDLAWFTALTAVTGGAFSPFAAFFVYASIAAAYRWGLIPTLATAAFASAVLVIQAAVEAVASPDVHFNLNIVVTRLAYFTLAGVLVGLLSEDERRLRFRSLAVTRIMSRVRAESGFVPTVRSVLEDLLGSYGADHAVLALQEDGGDMFVWSVSRAPAEAGFRVRVRRDERGQQSPYLVGLHPAVEAVKLWRRLGSDEISRAVAIDGHGIPIEPGKDIGAAALCEIGFPWRSALCLPNVSGDGWSGTLFVFDPAIVESARTQLRFIQGVMRQVGPALFNLYLQRRLQSRTGTADRARLSRELHDGMIQSLIGLEMEMEVLRREVAGSVPPRVETRLAELQQALVQEVLNSRDLMQTLRPVEVKPDNFVQHLARLVERFRHQTGIRADFSCTGDDIRISTRVCRELAAIVQEALTNARKHSRASNVTVGLRGDEERCRLTIEDDGRGFPFQGQFTLDELDEQGRGPVIIKERARSIGATFLLQSESGRGSRMIIDVAGRRSSVTTDARTPSREDASHV